VISPISSWGAYIIGILGGLFAANEITTLQPFEAFIKMIPLNFYALAAMILVFIVATFKLDIGSMRTNVKRGIENCEMLNTKNKKVPSYFINTFNPHEE